MLKKIVMTADTMIPIIQVINFKVIDRPRQNKLQKHKAVKNSREIICTVNIIQVKNLKIVQQICFAANFVLFEEFPSSQSVYSIKVMTNLRQVCEPNDLIRQVQGIHVICE